MAITLQEILAGQQRYLESQKTQTSTESISIAEFRELAKKSTEQMNTLIDTSIDIKKSLEKSLDPTAQAEKDQEAEEYQKKQIDLLEDIRDNTKKEKEQIKKEEGESALLSLGKVLAGLVIGAGTLAGIIKAYVKTIKLFAEALTPEFIKKKIIGAFEDLGKFFDKVVSKVKGVFNKGTEFIASFFAEVGAKFKQLFAVFSKSRFGASVIEFVKSLSVFVKPFQEALDAIKDVMRLGPINQLVSKLGGFFNTIKSTFGAVGKAFGFIANTVGKIFTPVFIIMTAFDTIMNVIDRFESDGIIGAFVGVFEGLFKSIVAAPLDLLKDIVSWILGALGFDKAQEFLDSFSFVDIVTGFVDAILSPIETIKKMFEGVVGFFEAIEIPKIGFTIPIIDKEVSIGPFYPFRKEGAAQGQTTGAEKTSAATSSAPQKGSREEYDAVYKQNLEKTGGNERIAQKLTARDVGLAPGAHPDTLPSTKGGAVINGEAAPASATVSGSGVSQQMLVPGGTSIPQATGPETREQTEARVRGALKAGVEEKQAEVRAIESGATVNGEAAPADRQAYYKAQGFTSEQISNLNARQAKIDALKSQDPNAKIDKDLAIMDAQAAAIKSTPAQPSESVAQAVAAPVPTANMVYNQSAQNATASQAPIAGPSNTIVSPTTVNNTKNEQIVHRADLRNQDSTFRRLLDGRFMPA